MLDLVRRLAARCGGAYLNATPAIRRRFNAAVLTEVHIAGGKVVGVDYREPFGVIFAGRTRTSRRRCGRRKFE